MCVCVCVLVVSLFPNLLFATGDECFPCRKEATHRGTWTDCDASRVCRCFRSSCHLDTNSGVCLSSCGPTDRPPTSPTSAASPATNYWNSADTVEIQMCGLEFGTTVVVGGFQLHSLLHDLHRSPLQLFLVDYCLSCLRCHSCRVRRWHSLSKRGGFLWFR